MAPSRTRTYTWDDPRVGPEIMRTMSGLEVLRGIIAGTLPAPPMGRLMDIRLIEVERGRAVFETTPAEFHYNPLGSVHGGMAATLLDSAMGCCVHSTLDAGDRYTTLEIKVNYLKAVTVDTGRVLAIATLVHSGRTTALAEARVVDAGGTVYAHATSTCLIKRAQ
ncbi:MAG TPA: PaaI family thioesterase [Vicinamibacterales bacterium]|nr:PaaI family thioesterase [Vicinamibacterales bacterium]